MHTKAQTSADQIIRTSISESEVLAASRWRPRDAARFAELYTGWQAICISKIAGAVACQPIRMYCTPQAARRHGIQTKGGVSKGQKAWLRSPGAGYKSSIFADMSDDIVQVADHPALRILWKPSKFQTGHTLSWIWEAMRLLTGDAFEHVIVDNKGVPTELWPMYAHWVTVQPSRTDFIEGYWYGRDATVAAWFERDEVIHSRKPSPFNPYYGDGETRSALSAIMRNMGMDEFQLHSLRNQARFDWVGVNKSGVVGKTQRDAFREEINRAHQGPENASRYMLLGGEWDITPMQWSPKDLNLNADEKDTRDRICAHYGVPVSMVTVEDVNRANGEIGSPQFLKYTVLPELNARSDTLTDALLPGFGFEEGEAWFAYDNPVPEDRQYMLARNTAYVSGGVMTRNEARRLEGMSESDDENADLLTVNGVPLSRAADPFGLGSMPFAADAEPVAADAPASMPMTSQEIQSLTQLAEKATAGLISVEAARAVAHAGFTRVPTETIDRIFNAVVVSPVETPTQTLGDASPEPEPEPGDDEPMTAEQADDEAEPEPEEKSATRVIKHSDIWAKGCGCPACESEDRKAEKAVGDDREPSVAFVRAVRQYYAMKSSAIVAQVNADGKGAKDIIDRVTLNSEDLRAALERLTSPHRQRAVRTGSAKALAQLGDAIAGTDVTSAIGVTNPNVKPLYEAATTRFIKSVGDEDERIIRQVILDGTNSGKTNAQIAQDVQESFRDMAGYRAETIARTETARAMSIGQEATYKATGIVSRKKWLLAPAACEFCRAVAANLGEQEIGKPFAKKGSTIAGASGQVYQLDYEDVEGPPLHPNDRCDMTAVIDRGDA